ncbi:MAG TPA: hypothetical protein VGM88_27315 [Kofleriaceae bacterium]|jgi:hypothetical protein
MFEVITHMLADVIGGAKRATKLHPKHKSSPATAQLTSLLQAAGGGHGGGGGGGKGPGQDLLGGLGPIAAAQGSGSSGGGHGHHGGGMPS